MINPSLLFHLSKYSWASFPRQQNNIVKVIINVPVLFTSLSSQHRRPDGAVAGSQSAVTTRDFRISGELCNSSNVQMLWLVQWKTEEQNQTEFRKDRSPKLNSRRWRLFAFIFSLPDQRLFAVVVNFRTCMKVTIYTSSPLASEDAIYTENSSLYKSWPQG